MKKYAEELAKFYGIEKSSSDYHTVKFSDGSVEQLKEANWIDVFNIKNFATFNSLKKTIYSTTIVVGKQTKVTPKSSNNTKKKPSINFNYKEAA